MSNAQEKVEARGTNRYGVVTWLFLRGMGLVYLISFLSMMVQVRGLIGERGILPACDLIGAAGGFLHGADRFLKLPTLAWLDCSDQALMFQCMAGAIAAAFAFVNVLPGPALVVAWAFCLSLSQAGQDFTSFQWDALLLECGFLSLFLVGWRARPTWDRDPPRVFVWAIRLVLFRLIFASGVVKLQIDANMAWRGLSALTHHFETQPLPNPISWYFDSLPAWFLQFGVIVVLAVELAAPFLIFAPRRARLAGCAVLAWFQVMCFVTGNFAFFNILTMVLCIPLLDDAALRRLCGGNFAPRFSDAEAASPRKGLVLLAPVWIPLSLLYSIDLLRHAGLQAMVPTFVYSLASSAHPFSIVSPYGLFATMTTERREIVIEGSLDGNEWREYHLPWKPGDIDRAPPVVAPHQPRLDWQLWFAALGTYRTSPWFLGLCLRLLKGAPEVEALFESVPFPGSRPKFIRAKLYRYTFATGNSRDGRWWRRELVKLYLEPVALADGGRLEVVQRIDA